MPPRVRCTYKVCYCGGTNKEDALISEYSHDYCITVPSWHQHRCSELFMWILLHANKESAVLTTL